ncbi:AraC family transcriptional regulator [Magnetospirillum molischianum]|uniref:Transcriptional regulator, AraC family n=1 Tax=Magnetospirillum molischianum DSM 120 TaxID=1150626 RepID=H8FR84_MAGML|nr:AraC family transcriptional regulator [Magnetospirillum molischianum]CCG40872.1 Transcriptional regulator, AraC family [Magnetospirillum molischianum DSM 120]
MKRRRDDIRLWTDQQIFGGLEILKASCVEFRYPLHSHEVFVIAALRDGAQKHQIARYRGVAYPGTVMIIPPGQVHTGESAERDTGWDYSALYPNPDVLEALSRELFRDSGGSLDFGTKMLIEDPELAARLIESCEIAEHSPDAVEREEAVYGALDVMIKRYGQRTGKGSFRKAPDARIRHALDYIHAHFHERLRLKDIAEHVDLSEFHFMRTFKAQMNVTVHCYLTQVRLDAAKVLLAAGNPTADAAVSTGFYDQSHFTGSFRRYFGVTPSRYATACR